MNLYEFITYCQIKGYVEDQHPVTISRDVHTIRLHNNGFLAAITYADEGIDWDAKYNITQYIPSGWTESHLEEVIAIIAPELL